MLQPGQPAPLFTTIDQDGNKISLQDFQGKKVALYFYPEDDTPGCTTESCNLRDNYSALQSAGVEVLGVSPDDQKSHKKFEEKYNLPFRLLVDTEKKIVSAYDVWGEKTNFGRTYMGTHRITYLIDEHGMITHSIDQVDKPNHASQILTLWGLDGLKRELGEN